MVKGGDKAWCERLGGCARIEYRLWVMMKMTIMRRMENVAIRW